MNVTLGAKAALLAAHAERNIPALHHHQCAGRLTLAKDHHAGRHPPNLPGIIQGLGLGDRHRAGCKQFAPGPSIGQQGTSTRRPLDRRRRRCGPRRGTKTCQGRPLRGQGQRGGGADVAVFHRAGNVPQASQDGVAPDQPPPGVSGRGMGSGTIQAAPCCSPTEACPSDAPPRSSLQAPAAQKRRHRHRGSPDAAVSLRSHVRGLWPWPPTPDTAWPPARPRRWWFPAISSANASRYRQCSRSTPPSRCSACRRSARFRQRCWWWTHGWSSC